METVLFLAGAGVGSVLGFVFLAVADCIAAQKLASIRKSQELHDRQRGRVPVMSR